MRMRYLGLCIAVGARQRVCTRNGTPSGVAGARGARAVAVAGAGFALTLTLLRCRTPQASVRNGRQVEREAAQRQESMQRLEKDMSRQLSMSAQAAGVGPVDDGEDDEDDDEYGLTGGSEDEVDDEDDDDE